MTAIRLRASFSIRKSRKLGSIYSTVLIRVKAGSQFKVVMSAFGTKRTCVSALRMSAFGGKADIACRGPLDFLRSSREHFTVLVPRVTSGTKEGTRTRRIRAFEFEAIRGCPRNCERRALGPLQPLGNWEGWTTRQRPASQETCQRGHPTGGRGVHTERSFAAVTAMPVRRP